MRSKTLLLSVISSPMAFAVFTPSPAMGVRRKSSVETPTTC